MGNLGFLVATKNLDKFNKDDVYDLLVKEFPKFDISKDEKFNRVSANLGNKNITDLYFNQKCYFLKYDEDIQYLKDPENQIFNGEQLANKLEHLRSLNPDLDNCVEMTHSSYHDERLAIGIFLMRYFEAYSFDEGIHPEYMPPDYQPKRKSFIKRFGDFLTR